MFGPRGGLGIGGIVVVGAMLYFSGAGRWMVESLKGLNENCYSAVSQLDPSVANLVCANMEKAFAAAGQFAETMKEKLSGSLGIGDGAAFADMRDAMQARFGALASSSDQLAQMMNAGPHALASGSLTEHFQQAIDSFSIGQHYMGQGQTAEALPWLQQGAVQPQGLGMMSQLALGDLYSSGQGGVKQDPAVAQLYYQQAQNSLSTLMGSGTPQSQQMLGALPASPQVIQQQLNQTILQLQQVGQR